MAVLTSNGKIELLTVAEPSKYDELAPNETPMQITPTEGWIAAFSAVAGAIAAGLGTAYRAGKAVKEYEDLKKKVREVEKKANLANSRIDRAHWPDAFKRPEDDDDGGDDV